MCSDLTLLPILKIIKHTFIIIEVIAPIIAIVIFTVLLFELMMDPQDKSDPKQKKIDRLKNAIFSLVIIFLIPFLINLTMALLGENFDLTSCWNNVENYTFSNGGYIQRESDKNKQKIINDKNYDEGGTGESSSTDTPVDTELTVEGNTSLEKWLNTLEALGKKLASYNFVYSNSNAQKTLEKAISVNRRTNCAHYVSLAMQEYGLLPKGKTIWLDNQFHGNGANYIQKSNKVTIYRPNKLVPNAGLQPGDIVGWKSANGQHTCVYAGTNSKGQRLWFSAGSGDVSSKNYGPKRKSYEKRTVHIIIRPKFNNM